MNICDTKFSYGIPNVQLLVSITDDAHVVSMYSSAIFESGSFREPGCWLFNYIVKVSSLF